MWEEKSREESSGSHSIEVTGGGGAPGAMVKLPLGTLAPHFRVLGIKSCLHFCYSFLLLHTQAGVTSMTEFISSTWEIWIVSTGNSGCCRHSGSKLTDGRFGGCRHPFLRVRTKWNPMKEPHNRTWMDPATVSQKTYSEHQWKLACFPDH